MHKLKVLVTGCGGDIGQSIGKILQTRKSFFEKIVGADLHTDHAGKFIFDECTILPRCDSEQYLEAVKKLIVKHEVDLIIPIAEPELRYITKNHFEEIFFGVPVIMANQLSRQIGFDKKATADFLQQNKLPFPKTINILEYNDSSYPVLIKSKDGSGSKSIHIVCNREEMDLYKKVYPDFITQELLKEGGGEFTCGLFRSTTGEIRDIILKRKLMGGFSGFGQRENHSGISSFLHRLAILLDLRGSINVQLKLINNIPYVFEINPRFSSTVLFRHLMGYEDVIWSIEDTFQWQLSDYSINQTITKFYKGFTEYVD
jgi:carbamoyl-phosphate synthase large subunit